MTALPDFLDFVKSMLAPANIHFNHCYNNKSNNTISLFWNEFMISSRLEDTRRIRSVAIGMGRAESYHDLLGSIHPTSSVWPAGITDQRVSRNQALLPKAWKVASSRFALEPISPPTIEVGDLVGVIFSAVSTLPFKLQNIFNTNNYFPSILGGQIGEETAKHDVWHL